MMISFNFCANKFLKFAGMLKAPEKLMNDIFELVASIVAQKYIWEIGGDKKEEIEDHQNLIQKISSNSFQLLSKFMTDNDWNHFIKEINTRNLFISVQNIFRIEIDNGYSIKINFYDEDRDIEYVLLNEIEFKIVLQRYKNKIKEKLKEIEIEAKKKYKNIEEYDKSTKVTRAFIGKYIKNKEINKDKYAYVFYFNSDELPYKIKSNILRNFYLDVNLIFGGPEIRKSIYPLEEWDGFWQEKRRSVLSNDLFVGTMYLTSENTKEITIESFQNELERLKIIINHETLHMIQSLYNSIKGIENFGRPNSKLNENFKSDQSGEKDIPHEFREVEFYTRVNDAKNIFILLMEKYKIPKFLWVDLLRNYNSELPLTNFIFIEKILQQKTSWSEKDIKNYLFNNIYLRIMRNEQFRFQRNFLLQLKKINR